MVKLKGKLVPLQISPQAAITKPKWSGYFLTCTARRGRPRQLLIQKNRRSSLTKKEKTVTRKFVCLADKTQADVPTVQEKRELFQGGLGEKKIALPVDGEFPRLHAVLVDSFPRLADAGGFELMYAEPGKRDLNVIPTGPGTPWHTFRSLSGKEGCIFVPSNVILILQHLNSMRTPLFSRSYAIPVCNSYRWTS